MPAYNTPLDVSETLGLNCLSLCGQYKKDPYDGNICGPFCVGRVCTELPLRKAIVATLGRVEEFTPLCSCYPT